MIDQKLMFPFFLKDIKRHTFKIGRHGFQNLWSRKFEWCEIRGWGEGLNQGRGNQEPVSRKPQKLFGPVKAIFSSSASENGLVYMPETSCMKRTMTVYNNNLWIGSRFCCGFTGPKSFRGFRETGPRKAWEILHHCVILYIGLTCMFDYITCPNFTTKLHLQSIFSNLWNLCVLFTRVFFSSLLPGEFVHENMCKLHFKSEAWWWNLFVWVMYKGYC